MTGLGDMSDLHTHVPELFKILQVDASLILQLCQNRTDVVLT